MTVMAQAAAAYGQSQSHIGTPRTTEYDIMARVTRALKTTALTRDTRFADFVAALHANRRLWTHLAASVADKDNSLAPEIRANIFYLAEFTETHSRKALSKQADIDVLLEINLSVMRGLLSEGSQQ